MHLDRSHTFPGPMSRVRTWKPEILKSWRFGNLKWVWPVTAFTTAHVQSQKLKTWKPEILKSWTSENGSAAHVALGCLWCALGGQRHTGKGSQELPRAGYSVPLTVKMFLDSFYYFVIFSVNSIRTNLEFACGWISISRRCLPGFLRIKHPEKSWITNPKMFKILFSNNSKQTTTSKSGFLRISHPDFFRDPRGDCRFIFYFL